MKPQDAQEAISAIVNTVPADEQPELFGLLKQSYPGNLGVVAVESAQVSETPQTELAPNALTWEQQLEELSPERRVAAANTREALVKKYEAQGYKPDDFSLTHFIRKDKDGQEEKTFGVALSATQAIDLGNPHKTYDKKRSWDSIDPTKANKQFVIKVNGKEFDEREGVTLETMRELTTQNPKISEWIWETGRPDLADDHGAPIVNADAGGAGRGRGRRGGSSDLVFRPVVVLE